MKSVKHHSQLQRGRERCVHTWEHKFNNYDTEYMAPEVLEVFQKFATHMYYEMASTILTTFTTQERSYVP